MLLYKAYKYSFYHFYAYGLKKWGANAYPQYWASFVVALFILLNIYSILLLSDAFLGTKLFSSIIDVNKGLRAVLTLAFFYINYLLLAARGKYKKVAAEFEKTAGNNKSAVYLGIYTLVTVILLFASMWIDIAKS